MTTPEGATPLQSALWEMGRLMEVFGENSVAAMEYRAKRLIEQDARFRAMTNDEPEGFYTRLHQLQDIITREISEGSPLFVELHTLAMELLLARERAAALAATEIADLRQQVRDLGQRLADRRAPLGVRVDTDAVTRAMKISANDYALGLRRSNTPPHPASLAVLQDFTNTFGRYIAADLEEALNTQEVTGA